jgi:hypothetical protein
MYVILPSPLKAFVRDKHASFFCLSDNGRHNLDCLSLAGFSSLILYNVCGKTGVYTSRAAFDFSTEISVPVPANTRLGWESLLGTNALAHYKHW